MRKEESYTERVDRSKQDLQEVIASVIYDLEEIGKTEQVEDEETSLSYERSVNAIRAVLKVYNAQLLGNEWQGGFSIAAYLLKVASESIKDDVDSLNRANQPNTICTIQDPMYCLENAMEALANENVSKAESELKTFCNRMNNRYKKKE